MYGVEGKSRVNLYVCRDFYWGSARYSPNSRRNCRKKQASIIWTIVSCLIFGMRCMYILVAVLYQFTSGNSVYAHYLFFSIRCPIPNMVVNKSPWDCKVELNHLFLLYFCTNHRRREICQLLCMLSEKVSNKNSPSSSQRRCRSSRRDLRNHWNCDKMTKNFLPSKKNMTKHKNYFLVA